MEENSEETKPDGWLLTQDEERFALEQAKIRKEDRIKWLAIARPDLDPGPPDLSEEEETKALIQANKHKELKMNMEAIALRRRMLQEESDQQLRKDWNYAKFFLEMRSRAYELANDERRASGDFFIYNEYTAPLIKTICFKLSRDPRYETEMGFKFSNGLIIRGNPGLGKSFIPGLVAQNPVCSVQVIPMNSVNEAIMSTGTFTGLSFSRYDLILLDDIGTEEPEIKVFGTSVTWFKTFIETTYAKDPMAMSRLILTTNSSFDELEQAYGFRVRDRLKEFDVLDLYGKTLRHN